MKTEYNLLDDLSVLTTISKYGLTDMSKIAEMCIAQAILEAKLNNQETVKIILGTLGELNVIITDSEVTYRYIPSKSLEKDIIASLQTNKSKLQEALENSLTKRVISVYKDLM